MNESKTAKNQSVKEMTARLEEGTRTVLVIKEGQALDDKAPVKIGIKGNITSISKFLEKRSALIDQEKCHLLVDRESLKMVLILNEEDPFLKGEITAALSRTEDLKGWKINTGETWEPEVLASHIKMNRFCFESKDEAMKLFSEMKHFRAKVNKEIEKHDDGRGNTKNLKEQAVESNLPETFNLCLPIFKGEEKMVFTVEVGIHPHTLECSLMSPELKDYIKQEADRLIDRELGLIKTEAETIAVIEV